MTLPAFAGASPYGPCLGEIVEWCGANHVPCEPASFSLLLYPVRTYIRDEDYYAGFLPMRCVHSLGAKRGSPVQQDYCSVPNPKKTIPIPQRMNIWALSSTFRPRFLEADYFTIFGDRGNRKWPNPTIIGSANTVIVKILVCFSF